jgi:hypothetical protein
MAMDFRKTLSEALNTDEDRFEEPRFVLSASGQLFLVTDLGTHFITSDKADILSIAMSTGGVPFVWEPQEE